MKIIRLVTLLESRTKMDKFISNKLLKRLASDIENYSLSKRNTQELCQTFEVTTEGIYIFILDHKISPNGMTLSEYVPLSHIVKNIRMYKKFCYLKPFLEEYEKL